MSIHDRMVPFWQRRLLTVTLPLTLLAGGTLLAGLIFVFDRLRFAAAEQTRALARPDPAGPVLAVALAVPLTLVAVLAVERALPRGRLGAGYWIARAAMTVQGTLYVLASATGFALMFDSAFYQSTSLFFLWAMPGSALGVFAIQLLTGEHRPRTEAIRVAAGRLAYAAVALLAVTGPVLLALWVQSTRPEGVIRLGGDQLLEIAVAQAAILLPWLGSSLVVAFFAGRLTLRHGGHHARHCHGCGYDLLHIEATACPECGTGIGFDQLDALVSLSASGPASNGSHSSSSPPT